ncbi:MAG: hypothetical protein AAF922_03595 [Pseudomonadota bacterium]
MRFITTAPMAVLHTLPPDVPRVVLIPIPETGDTPRNKPTNE